MRTNIVKDKTFAFAIRIVKLDRHLREEKRELVLSKQLLRSGTAIGALVRESQQAEGKSDFVHKLSIALKEAHETDYWLDLLKETDLLDARGYDSIHADLDEIVKLLTSIIKSTKSKR